MHMAHDHSFATRVKIYNQTGVDKIIHSRKEETPC